MQLQPQEWMDVCSYMRFTSCFLLNGHELALFQIPDCQRDKDEKPAVTDFVAQIQKIKSVDCSVARCSVFKCSRFMGRQEGKVYKISANLSSGWIEQIGLSSAKFLLTSTASLEYDRNQYIFFSTGSNNNPPVHKVEAEVEVYPVPDFTKEIVGGSLGGLVLLALLTAGLYKVRHSTYSTLLQFIVQLYRCNK
uniref:integrin alpha-X-like n=1 Tax=Monopterus albus TaxID=43700 RepID=UPI0009B3CC66